MFEVLCFRAEVLRLAHGGNVTPERLEEITASLVGQTDRDKASELAAEVRRLHEAVRLAAGLIREGHDETCNARYGAYRCRCDAEEREEWLRAYASSRGERA